MIYVILAIAVLVMAYVTVWINTPIKDELTNKEYERLFCKYVHQIDERNPQWMDASLKELKRGYAYYWESPRAMSTLELLEEAIKGERPEIVHFIKSCNKYRKKKLKLL